MIAAYPADIIPCRALFEGLAQGAPPAWRTLGIRAPGTEDHRLGSRRSPAPRTRIDPGHHSRHRTPHGGHHTIGSQAPRPSTPGRLL